MVGKKKQTGFLMTPWGSMSYATDERNEEPIGCEAVGCISIRPFGRSGGGCTESFGVVGIGFPHNYLAFVKPFHLRETQVSHDTQV